MTAAEQGAAQAELFTPPPYQLPILRPYVPNPAQDACVDLDALEDDQR